MPHASCSFGICTCGQQCSWPIAGQSASRGTSFLDLLNAQKQAASSSIPIDSFQARQETVVTEAKDIQWPEQLLNTPKPEPASSVGREPSTAASSDLAIWPEISLNIPQPTTPPKPKRDEFPALNANAGEAPERLLRPHRSPPPPHYDSLYALVDPPSEWLELALDSPEEAPLRAQIDLPAIAPTAIPQWMPSYTTLMASGLPLPLAPAPLMLAGPSTAVPKILQHMPNGGPVFNDILYQFKTSWHHTSKPIPKVLHVYKINAPDANAKLKYDMYLARVGNEQRLWHGTTRRCTVGDDPRRTKLCEDKKCALCCIVRTSYQKEFAARGGMFGRGIYTSTTSSKSDGYSHNHSSRYNTILLNKVATGNTYFTHEADRGRTVPPEKFDSVCALPGKTLKFDETCVYDDDAIRPTFLIIYDPATVG